MVFSSPVFLFLFLPVVLILSAMAGSMKAKNTVLLLASLFFYAWGEHGMVLLMMGTALFNHACGLVLERSGAKRTVLALTVTANLAALIWFKYANFIVDSLAAIGIPMPTIDPVHLPIGISFFIFHSISYVVDVYRGTARAQTSPGITALYIALFPQLVAGPIIRYHDVADQFTRRRVGMADVATGLRRFIVGLAKKILIADLCARIADPIFEVPMAQLTAPVAWLGIVAYAVQIYFDFSGYSDMAIGLGRIFGFRFLENFDRPYIARSLRDFWKRWHISLTNFFRDYLYIPMGGNRKGPVRTYVNLLLVFFVTGLWHGASWNFVVWGMLHGTFMLVERAGMGARLDRAPRPLAQAYTLLVVLTTWVFFRIEDITGAWRYLQVMWTWGHGDPLTVYPHYYLPNDNLLALAIGVTGSLGAQKWLVRAAEPLRGTMAPALPWLRNGALVGLLLLSLMAVATRTFDPFIYFRF